MNLARLWRTARHLSREQTWSVAARRLRHMAWRRWPAAARRRIDAAAQALPLPNPGGERLQRLAAQVLVLQTAVHEQSDGIADGRFTFLGRTVDFGALDAIEWRRDLGEESSPLWRLTLAYFGWALPLIVERGPDSLPCIATALAGLERAGDWSTPGVFRDLWNPYTASHRLINLLSVAALHREAGGAATPAESLILGHVRFCAAYIAADLERDLQLNHLLKNYVALAIYASATRTVPPALGFLARAVPRSLRQVVLDDGGHAERAPMYHALGLIDLRVLRDSGVFVTAWQPELDRRITVLERALACLTHPDGDIALFGDSWLGGAPPATRLGLPPITSGWHDLATSGYVRLAADGDCVIFDRGPIGPDLNPAHGHADYLAIEVSVAGQRLVVDFATPTYAAGALRDLCRSAAVHNGPRLRGAEPAELWKSFRVGRRGRAGPVRGPGLDAAPLWAAGWQNGYADRGVDVRRWVGLWPGQGFVVVDCWSGAVPGAALSDFIIAPSWCLRGGDPPSFEGPAPLDVMPLIGWIQVTGEAAWWPRYGESQSATGLRLLPDNGIAVAAFFRRGFPLPFTREAARKLGQALARARASTVPPA